MDYLGAILITFGSYFLGFSIGYFAGRGSLNKI